MMYSVVCSEPGRLSYEQRPEPTYGPDQILIRVKRVGICGTDMHIYRGKQPYLSYPRVMGHELAGEVVWAPHGSGFAAGGQVCVLPYLSCGKCIACRKDRPNCCVKMQVLGVHRDGGLSQFIAVPTKFVLKIDDVTLDEGAMVEFLAIGAHAVSRAGPRSGDRVLVVGAGPIGLATVLFSKLRGASVAVLDARLERLKFSQTHLHADHIIPLNGETDAVLANISQGEFFDVVFDASGNSSALTKGFHYVAHAGTYALISVVSQDIAFSDPEFHKREMTLLGCRNATIDDFNFVLNAMRQRLIPTEAFITHRAALENLPEAFKEWLDPASEVIKAIVEC